MWTAVFTYIWCKTEATAHVGYSKMGYDAQSDKTETRYTNESNKDIPYPCPLCP